MKDPNANFTMQLGGDIAWNVESDLTGQQSTVIAAAPEGYDPFTIVSATTFLKVNPLATMGASIAKKTIDGFLGGVCENYKCADISGRSYEDIDGRKAWVAVTKLNLKSYEDLGVPEAVMIATVSPEGYMQLFSLHTAEGKAAEMEPILIEAIKTIKSTNP
ncbi:hypothetical protein [Thioclava sp.]|uniref:hypothetical protein n=1 Tax=Thioclava sp. TaxID=1933450 RepID=UPI003AA97E63